VKNKLDIWKQHKTKASNTNGKSEKDNKKQIGKVPKELRFKQGQKLKFATLNAQGLLAREKYAIINQIMRDIEIDVLCLQETHINTNSVLQMEEFFYIFSTDITDEQREKQQTKKDEAGKQKEKGKGKGKGKGRKGKNATNKNEAYEAAGVGIVCSKQAKLAMIDFEQISGRIIKAKFAGNHNPLTVVCTYAPQSGNDTDIKERYYETMKQQVQKIPEAEFMIIMGDCNARIQHRKQEEFEMIGPNIFGRGEQYLETINENTAINREMFINMLATNDLTVMNTFLKKSRNITARLEN